MDSDQTDIVSLDSRLDSFLGALGPLATISEVARLVLTLLGEDLDSSEKLKTVVKHDPIMTTAVLSAAAIGPECPCTLEQAWQVLGPAQILSVVLSTAVAGIDVQSQSAQASSSFDRGELWRHSLAVALISRTASGRLSKSPEPLAPMPNQDDTHERAYTAGLLHDLGKLVFSSAVPKSLSRAWQLARTEGQDLLDAERQVFGFDHTALGRRLARKLHLSASLVKTIWLHHHPGHMLPEDSPGQDVLPLVIFADTLANELSLGESGHPDLPVTAAELAEQIGLSSECLAQLRRNIPQELDDAALALQLDEPSQAQQSIEALARVVANMAGLHAQLKEKLAEQLTQLTEAETLSQRFAEISRRAARKLERKTLDAELAQVAAGAAHELNNPLAVIAGRSQILAKQETDPKKKEALELIGSQARQAADIASELLDAVRPPTPTQEPTELEPIIRKLCGALAGKAQLSDSEVNCELPSHLPRAFVDPEMFEQSLLEILKNALAALAEKPGTISVRCHVDELQEKLTLEVADSGIGMDPTVARNAFVPFFSFAPAGRGRGLGLTRAKAFIEANQGRLWLRSQPSQGTTLWMSVPLAKDR